VYTQFYNNVAVLFY